MIVTLFGNGALAFIVKLEWSRTGIEWAWNTMTGIRWGERDLEKDKQKEASHVKKGVEIEVMQLQAKGH